LLETKANLKHFVFLEFGEHLLVVFFKLLFELVKLDVQELRRKETEFLPDR